MRALRWSAPLLAAALLLAVPAGAQAVIVPFALKTYKVSIDVDLDVTQKTFWKGIRPGCYAPAENFSMTYRLDLRTHRPNAPKPMLTAATLSARLFGTGLAYGAEGSFRQSGSPGPWELQVSDPAPCPKSSPPPPWAISPGCNTISERLWAQLATNGDDESDPDALALGRDGSLLLTRGPRAKLGVRGASIRPQCYRTLHDITPVGRFSEIGISPISTVIRVPVPLLQRKLIKLAAGSAKARPSFRVDIDVDSYCQAMAMKPSLGRNPDFPNDRFSQAHDALGSFNGEAERTGCTIEAKGRAIVRRESAVASTSVRLP